MLGMITGALVAMVIDFLLKEGQGLGASGYRDHIVVCGWNTTARDLIGELRGDDYKAKVVVLADLEKNPAGDDAYFVRGESTNEEDLKRAGIEEASAALIFPRDASDESDMHSILTILAIEHAAPGVRTVAEVNNPKHEAHFRRADVDELLVTSKIASHLLARSALYPGLSGIVTDIVSGGEGSELYRISLPDDYCGQSITEVSTRLRTEHRATLLSINRGGTRSSTQARISCSSPVTMRSWSQSRSGHSHHSRSRTPTSRLGQRRSCLRRSGGVEPSGPAPQSLGPRVSL
jgi:voltage-gated potassium channel